MDFSGLASLAGGPVTAQPTIQGGPGGVMGMIQRMMQNGGMTNPQQPAPAVPADGAMQPTIGPGMPPPQAPPAYRPKFGLPSGGLLGVMQGTPPNGVAGLLQHLMPKGGGPLGQPPGAGMIGPQQPQQPNLPNVDPMNQF